jgi:hypothetical protein
MGRKRFAYNRVIKELAESGFYRMRRGHVEATRFYKPGGNGAKGGGCIIKTHWTICDKLDGKGYYYLSWNGCRPKAHRVAYWLYNGAYDLTLEINHKDGNGLNNSKRNLELVTPRGQSEHAYRTGLNTSAVLTERQVKAIKKLLRTTRVSMAELGRRYGVTAPTIRAISIGTTWKWVECD